MHITNATCSLLLVPFSYLLLLPPLQHAKIQFSKTSKTFSATQKYPMLIKYVCNLILSRDVKWQYFGFLGSKLLTLKTSRSNLVVLSFVEMHPWSQSLFIIWIMVIVEEASSSREIINQFLLSRQLLKF